MARLLHHLPGTPGAEDSPPADVSREQFDLSMDENSSGRKPFYLSPFRMIALLVVTIVSAEIFFVNLLGQFPRVSPAMEVFIASTIHLLIMVPLYFAIYFPFRAHWHERQRSLEENRRLSRQLMEAAEEEKRRLARDIHDECGQTLAVLQLGMATLQQTLPKDDPALQGQVHRLIELTTRLGSHIQNVSANLRPGMLESAGLVPTLRLHVRNLAEEVSTLHCDFHAQGMVKRLPQRAEIVLFRICQEALNNIVKHSRATKAVVRLKCDLDKVRLTVEDDGIGFDGPPERGRPSGGTGIAGMRERAASLGGALKIVSQRGKGTSVQVEIPLRGEEALSWRGDWLRMD